MKFLGFCKGKYNKILHIFKEALKYYYLPINDKIQPEFKELLNFFIDYNQNSTEKNNSDLNMQMKKEEDKEINSIYGKPLKIKFSTAIDFLLNDNFGNEVTISEIEKSLKEIESKKIIYINKYIDSVQDGYKKLLFLFDEFDNKSKKDSNLDIFTKKEKILITDEKQKFQKSLISLETNLLELNKIKDLKKMNIIINKFFSEFHGVAKSELQFDSDYFLYLCDTVEGRYLLVYFQIKLMKYQLLDIYSQKYFLIIDESYRKNKQDIMTSLFEFKTRTSNLIDEVKKITRIKPVKQLFMEWKFNRYLLLETDFETFINEYKSLITSIDIIINDEFISDQVTSLWLIKNDLDEFID